jgi:dTDP-4-amino-4,6-dideoxygalactose transaminase
MEAERVNPPNDEFLPFVRPHVDEATIADVAAVLRSGWITTGPRCQALEARLSELMGGRLVRVFANGTSTMEVALRVAGVGPGDEVITTPITWVATANVVGAVGARVVFADVDPVSRNISLDALEAAITPRTRALMPVYLAGLPVDMARLYAIAARHGLRVVEDAAQAFDARWNGQRIGAFGDLASFSFQANKNITCAEGGCLVLADADEARRAERLRLQGVVRSGPDGMYMTEPGGKSNLSDVHAAIGLGQLAKLESVTARRRALAERYFEAAAACSLADAGVALPPRWQAEGASTNWHMFQVELPLERLRADRAAVMLRLRELGVGTGVHYPAIHLFTHYRLLGGREGQFPHAERLGRALLTLPLFPQMRDDDPLRVCRALTQVLDELST